jgi:Domain of unknown function (DUF1707)
MSDDPRPSPQRAGLRASDEDREQLVSQLHEHAVAGRLSTDELEDRLGAAYAAKTTGELQALRDDLPATARDVALTRDRRRSQLTRRLIQETGGSAALFVLCTAIWLVSDSHRGQFWPVWVLIVVLLSLVRNGWALFGPAPDLDAVEAHLDDRRAHRLQRDQRRANRRGGG